MSDLSKLSTDELRAELMRRDAGPSPMRPGWPSSPIGIWHVTTEGDCEGKTTRDLGIHRGHVGDIAMMLAGSCCYGLNFKPVAQDSPKAAKTATTNIALDIGSGTWDMEKRSRAASVAAWLGSGFVVRESNYYACVEVSRATDTKDGGAK